MNKIKGAVLAIAFILLFAGAVAATGYQIAHPELFVQPEGLSAAILTY